MKCGDSFILGLRSIRNLQINTYQELLQLQYDLESEYGNEPYYPILTKENIGLFERYKNKAEGLLNFKSCGRLADYKYYNMDQAILKALEVAKELGVS